jgi:fatty acid synthase subunit beta, fungi type
LELDEPEAFLDRFFAKYPNASSQILASEDVKFFINLCQRPGQKPVPFIPVLDSSFGIWFKKVSHLRSERVSLSLEEVF